MLWEYSPIFQQCPFVKVYRVGSGRQVRVESGHAPPVWSWWLHWASLLAYRPFAASVHVHGDPTGPCHQRRHWRCPTSWRAVVLDPGDTVLCPPRAVGPRIAMGGSCLSRVWRTADCKHRLATERAGASRGQAAGEGCYQSC